MTDIALVFRPEHLDFDLVLDSGDLLGDEGINTPVIISIFTDRLAKTGDRIPDAQPGQPGDPRGWWGDAVDPDAGAIGSRLWLLNREKQREETLIRARQYAAEAVDWIKEERLADEVLTHVRAAAPGWLEISVECRNTRLGEYRTARWTMFVDYASGTIKFAL